MLVVVNNQPFVLFTVAFTVTQLYVIDQTAQFEFTLLQVNQLYTDDASQYAVCSVLSKDQSLSSSMSEVSNIQSPSVSVVIVIVLDHVHDVSHATT
jgi:hypothetical protein